MVTATQKPVKVPKAAAPLVKQVQGVQGMLETLRCNIDSSGAYQDERLRDIRTGLGNVEEQLKAVPDTRHREVERLVGRALDATVEVGNEVGRLHNLGKMLPEWLDKISEELGKLPALIDEAVRQAAAEATQGVTANLARLLSQAATGTALAEEEVVEPEEPSGSAQGQPTPPPIPAAARRPPVPTVREEAAPAETTPPREGGKGPIEFPE